ncbi:MAG: nitroreductase family protein [Candidatus Nanohalobium sp.]
MSTFDNVRALASFSEAKDETIARKTMGKILEAARNSPSPGNVQSLEMIVVESDEKLEMLAETTGDHRVREAPTTVILISDIDRMKRRIGNGAREAANSEIACAVQNMRLVAMEDGIHSAWISGYNEHTVGEQFNIPEGKAPLAVVSFAYTDHPNSPEQKFGMNDICFYDSYDNQIGSVFDSVEWKGLREEREVYGKKSKGLIDKVKRRLRKVL